jgi:hypothetical protein
MDLVVTALSAIQADLRRQKEAIGTCTALSRTRVISKFMRFAPGKMKSSVMLEGPRHFWLETFPEVVHSENLNMLASRYSSLNSKKNFFNSLIPASHPAKFLAQPGVKTNAQH